MQKTALAVLNISILGEEPHDDLMKNFPKNINGWTKINQMATNLIFKSSSVYLHFKHMEDADTKQLRTKKSCQVNYIGDI